MATEDGYEALETSLTAALDGESMPAELQYAKELLGLWMCEETRADCDISQVTEETAMGMVHQTMWIPVQILTTHSKKIMIWMGWVTLVIPVHWYRTLPTVNMHKMT